MKLFISTLLITLTLVGNSQVKPDGTYKDYFQEGLYLLLENNYETAKDNFEAAYKLDSSSANIYYQLGICYFNSALKKQKAEYFFSKAVKNISRTYQVDSPTEKAAPPLALLYYGKALHINYKFDEAIAQFDEFSKYMDAKSKDWQKMAAKEKAASKMAKEIVGNPLNLQIDNLGDSVNSPYPEYAPVLSADERTIIFTTRRPNSTGGLLTPDGQYFEDIVVSYKDNNDVWSKPVSLSANVNTPGHEASINLSPDGQTLIVFKGNVGSGNIYYTTYDGKDWTALQEFGSDVNTNYFESHACLNVDGSVLFFTSDRPGGYGGRDIYRCVKLPNGNWSKALNMGPTVNTEYDEDGAFMHPDGKTFFFASKGDKTIGGFDIMFATLTEENTLVDITNMGYPINTPDDDVFYVTSPDGKRGYFTSDKEGGFGEKDIYKLSIAESKEAFLALFKGQIIPADGEKMPENLTIIVREKESGKIVGTYLPKLANGTFATILPPGKEYNFSYQSNGGEEFYNEDVFVTNELTYREIKREVNLEPVKLIGKVKAKDKGIILNLITLETSKNKKPVSGTKITLTELDGQTKTFTANSKGRYEGVNLQENKKYTVLAELGELKSTTYTINTTGVKSGKIINQILYIKPTVKKPTSKELMLGVIVKNSKTLKMIPNANITLTDADGEDYDVTTNDKGEIKGIELSPDTKYEIKASSEGSVSDKQTISTQGISKKRFMKTLFIDPEEKGESPKFEKLNLRKKQTSKELLLGVIVKNSKTLRMIPNVKITLIDADGEYYDVTTNDKGEIKGIELSPDTKYQLHAVSNDGTMSNKQTFSTEGVKGSKRFMKTLFIDQDDADNTPIFERLTLRKKATSNKLLLGVIVRNAKTLKIIPNVKITLIDADGEYYDVTTNEKGEIKGIELSPDTRYELSAISEDGSIISDKQQFSTEGVKGRKNFNKTLYLNLEPGTTDTEEPTPVMEGGNASGTSFDFEIYYKYNRNIPENEDAIWISFIDKVSNLSKTQVVKIGINASASKVPTRAFKGNQDLANRRATNLQNKIIDAVAGKGGQKENLKFSRKAIVGGPAYKGDWDLGREKYEKHQFAKAKIK